ncbi:MAG: hypothetical protein PHQ43_10760 [Dehalococcoidales bacterium]|nr:hypothetical protein [Dehalococcoidales bacterium]
MIQELWLQVASTPCYPSLKAAFEQGNHFAVTNVYRVGDVVAEAEAVAESASEEVPCCYCGRDVKAYPKVGWAILVGPDALHNGEAAIMKGVRLCLTCCEALTEEEKSRDDWNSPNPKLPYVKKLVILTEPTDLGYRQWGVFRPDNEWP